MRVWLQTGDAPWPARELLDLHPGLVIAKAAPAAWSALQAGSARPEDIYLVDPLGNLVLRFPVNPDIKRMAKDLERVLRASRIG